ncbi:MAG TPA: UDP-N-acetylglucosamine 2-epimerase [Polyangiaceae bacterium LLY-WYZ-14_1]|nr:UDP-N-acetylglucosamine 2-epimerase [Polyangiaceae bacterium LLY-WYZ-14_1]
MPTLPPDLDPGHERLRRVVFLSGTRADFGKIKSLIRVLEDAPGFEPHVFATGMHMEPRYGFTVREIEKCGFRHVYRYINQAASAGEMDRCLAQTIVGFGDYLRLVQPDLVVVHGDRGEALAGALCGSLNNVRVAHVEGGEVSGTIDELIRHAVTKMSHLHFVSTEGARRRLIQLGEDPATVWVIGSPDVDVMNSAELPSLEEVRAHYEIPFHRYAVLAWHPVTTEDVVDLQRQTRALIAAAQRSERSFVVVYPNSDRGSDVILAEYERSLVGDPRFRLFPSIRFEAMLVLLEHADFVLGNSSMGIREAPYYGVPTIDVGSRQRGRSDNRDLLHVDARVDALLSAMTAADDLRPHLAPRREWGDGQSHRSFLDVLQAPAVWNVPVQKRFRDLPDASALAQAAAAGGKAPPRRSEPPPSPKDRRNAA